MKFSRNIRRLQVWWRQPAAVNWWIADCLRPWWCPKQAAGGYLRERVDLGPSGSQHPRGIRWRKPASKAVSDDLLRVTPKSDTLGRRKKKPLKVADVMRMRPEILIAIRVRNWKLPILRGRQFPSGALTVDILTATDTNRGDQVAISSSYLVCFQPLTWPKWKVSKWKSAHWTRGQFRLPATRAGDRQGQLSVTWFDGPVDDIQPLFFRVQLMDIKSEDGSRHIPLGRMRLIVAGHFLGRWGAFPAFPPPIAGSDAHDLAFLKNWPTCKQHPRWTGTECFHILKVQSSVEVKLRKKNFFKPKPLPFTGIFF